MGCTSSKDCCDSDCELPEHRIRSSGKKSHHHKKRSHPQHYFYSTKSIKSRRSSNSSISSQTPMIQRDSMADMRDIIASMGGWHESDLGKRR